MKKGLNLFSGKKAKRRPRKDDFDRYDERYEDGYDEEDYPDEEFEEEYGDEVDDRYEDEDYPKDERYEDEDYPEDDRYKDEDYPEEDDRYEDEDYPEEDDRYEDEEYSDSDYENDEDYDSDYEPSRDAGKVAEPVATSAGRGGSIVEFKEHYPERGGDDENSDDDSGKKGKKKKKEGFFARLLKALTKEDDDSAEGLASLTDENQQVLNELGEEGKGKKEKKKKEKKPKKEKPKKEKPPNKEKPPKPKKEKKPKPPKDPGVPEKAIAPKKVAICAIFAASLGILFVIPSMVIPESVTSTRASNAYKQREYTTAYKLLYGKERTEEQDNIYEQSRVLAWAERYLNGYENYIAMNMEEEALDMLLMAMRNHDDLLEEAAKYGVEVQVQSVYDSIESLLSANYGLGADDIAEINSIKKERDYTIRIMEIVGTLES